MIKCGYFSNTNFSLLLLSHDNNWMCARFPLLLFQLMTSVDCKFWRSLWYISMFEGQRNYSWQRGALFASYLWNFVDFCESNLYYFREYLSLQSRNNCRRRDLLQLCIGNGMESRSVLNEFGIYRYEQQSRSTLIVIVSILFLFFSFSCWTSIFLIFG